jgi:hypothetical protein
MKGSCTSLSHPRGEATGKVTKESAKAIFREIVCPVCGRVQGIRRIQKKG